MYVIGRICELYIRGMIWLVWSTKRRFSWNAFVVILLIASKSIHAGLFFHVFLFRLLKATKFDVFWYDINTKQWYGEAEDKGTFSPTYKTQCVMQNLTLQWKLNAPPHSETWEWQHHDRVMLFLTKDRDSDGLSKNRADLEEEDNVQVLGFQLKVRIFPSVINLHILLLFSVISFFIFFG